MNHIRTRAAATAAGLLVALSDCSTGPDPTPPFDVSSSAPAPTTSTSPTSVGTPAGATARPTALAVPDQKPGELARTIYRDGGTTTGSLLAGSSGRVTLTLACTSLEGETTMRYAVLAGVSTSDPAALGDQADAGEVSCDGAVVEDQFVVPQGHRVTVNLTETDDVDQGYAIARTS